MVQATGVRKNFKWSFTMYKLPTNVSLGCAKEKVIHFLGLFVTNYPIRKGA